MYRYFYYNLQISQKENKSLDTQIHDVNKATIRYEAKAALND